MDHYPWNETERANLLADMAHAMQLISPPAGSLTPPPPARQRPPILTRYGVSFCSLCKFEASVCRCGLDTPDSPSKDARGEADLSRRISECKGR